MLCQTCQKREATIHYFESVNGQSRTMNLCEECAAKSEMADLTLNIQISAGQTAPQWDRSSYERLMAKPNGALTCVGCGLALEAFLAERQYRCPACRDTFRHTMGAEVQAASEEAELKAQLDEAVAAEDFERAAEIRDKLQEAGHV